MIRCPEFSSCKVVVMGDVMLDRYWQGDTSRISPEAPVPVVKIDECEDRVGGAANVAVNLAALGVHTTLIGLVGDDNAAKTLENLLIQKGVHCQLVSAENHPTTVKLRVVGRHQQLLRLDFEDRKHWPTSLFMEKLRKVLTDADVLILSDYAKGVLNDPREIIQYANQCGVKVLVDPKRADLEAYYGAHCLTPNKGEFEASVGTCSDPEEIERKGKALLKSLHLEALLVTQGSQGMTLIEAENMAHIPARAREVYDVTGAGDTVIAILGAMMAAKQSMINAAELANIGAGIAVGKLGTATVTHEELLDEMMPHMKLGSGILSSHALLEEVTKRKHKREKIVMTNGCFDVLHAGHVTYLKQARALGDCLVIAVNDDDSVKRLKGESIRKYIRSDISAPKDGYRQY